MAQGAQEEITIKIDAELKDDVEYFFKCFNMDLNAATEAFYRQAVKWWNPYFVVHLEDLIQPEKEEWYGPFSTMEELLESLNS